MSDTVPRAEYDRVLTQCNHLPSENDALRLDVAQLRSQLAPQAQRSSVAQIFAPQAKLFVVFTQNFEIIF